MQPIRKLAVFTDANGMYYNPRTMVEVDESLLQLTPAGCWLFDAHDAVANVNELGAGKFTAMNFLSFMMTLNRVFIQDAAAMLVLHPEKIDHPLFQLEVFWSVEFSVSFLFLFLLFCSYSTRGLTCCSILRDLKLRCRSRSMTKMSCP
jgi:hypothetical protein